MIRAVLLVPERAAGWRPEGVLPLLNPAENGAHAALSAAGVPLEVMSEATFRSSAVQSGWDLVVLACPTVDSCRAAESALESTSGCLLRIQDRPVSEMSRGPRLFRNVTVDGADVLLEVSRLPLRSRAPGWRSRFSFPAFTVLRPEREDEVVGRWNRGGPALLRRSRDRLKIWTAGFPPDHLAAEGLARLLDLLLEGRREQDEARDPVPAGGQAVVILLHDVEEALPDDPRGLRSVQEGTEACLESEARHGFRATYNVVGTFAEQIPALVKRMVAEGHEVASHGATHRVVADLDPTALLEEVKGAEDRIGRISGTRVRGFRSPRSRWSRALLDLVAERDYLWNAEVDPSPFPYSVPGGGRGRLVRVPVAVDDWDYVRDSASPGAVLDLWKREVLSAEERGCWVSIGSHPSVLGVHSARVNAFGRFLEWLSDRKVRVMTLGEASAWWLSRTAKAEGCLSEIGS